MEKRDELVTDSIVQGTVVVVVVVFVLVFSADY